MYSFRKKKLSLRVRLITSGGYGYVCRASDVANPDQKYAIKKINIMDDLNEQAVRREISLWESLGAHPNICA